MWIAVSLTDWKLNPPPYLVLLHINVQRSPLGHKRTWYETLCPPFGCTRVLISTVCGMRALTICSFVICLDPSCNWCRLFRACAAVDSTYADISNILSCLHTLRAAASKRRVGGRQCAGGAGGGCIMYYVLLCVILSNNRKSRVAVEYSRFRWSIHAFLKKESDTSEYLIFDGM
jgi:hypothetical protein